MYDNHTTERQQGIEPAQMQDNGDSDVIDVRAFLLVLWRRKWIIFNVALITIVMSAIVVFQLTPRYTAKAMLAIETRQNRVVDLEAVMSGLGTDQAAIKTEIDVLQSRRLVGKLVDDVNLVNDPEFNAELREGRGFLQAINPFTYLPDEWSAAIFGRRKAEQSPEEAAQATRARVVDQLLSQMTVANPPRSYTLEVAVESADPKKAAKIANGLANLYLTDQLEVKFEATERANEWLNERVFELREKVRLAEQEAQQFREENQLIQTQSAGLVNDQQLAQLNTQLVTARTDLARIEARERQIEQNIVDGTVEESGLLEVVQSPLIQRLKEQESEVRRRRAELATRYGPKHPRMMNVEAELADVRTKISLEIDKIVAGIRGEAEVAAIRVTTLEQNLEALKQESFKNSRAQVRMRELDREAEANRLLLQTFLTRFKETSSSDGMQQADARIISKADVPVYASFPKKRIIMVVAAVIGLGAGVALAFLMESLDNGYRSPEHLKQDLNLRPLGMIPLVGKAVLQSGGPEKYIISKPSSSFAEAHRSIHASLMFSGAGGATPKVLAVTSSIPGEGKSTATLCLAHILGRTGLKILVVEADMRRPVLRKRLGLEKGSFVSLNDVLSREPIPAGLSIYADDVSGIHVLWTDKEENPQKRFAAPEFQSFLSEARKQYDLVLIDTPPIMAVSDA
ncbi:GumC family protein [Kordiimonas gwangyangensis]|nr:polysaccharide biosynthesis tyrosine autokinase [Kordiimonas gwangyangensis]